VTKRYSLTCNDANNLTIDPWRFKVENGTRAGRGVAKYILTLVESSAKNLNLHYQLTSVEDVAAVQQQVDILIATERKNHHCAASRSGFH
jgi:hypothetical protein